MIAQANFSSKKKIIGCNIYAKTTDVVKTLSIVWLCVFVLLCCEQEENWLQDTADVSVKQERPSL